MIAAVDIFPALRPAWQLRQVTHYYIGARQVKSYTAKDIAPLRRIFFCFAARPESKTGGLHNMRAAWKGLEEGRTKKTGASRTPIATLLS